MPQLLRGFYYFSLEPNKKEYEELKKSMKHLFFILVSLASCLFAMEPNFKFPREISLYQKHFIWADEQEREEEDSALLHAISERICALKRQNKTLNCNDNGETSVLFDLAHHDEFAPVVEELMRQGACPNFKTVTGDTPFEHSLRSNAVRNAWHMIGAGADCCKGLLVLEAHMRHTADPSLFSAQQVLLTKLLKEFRFRMADREIDSSSSRFH